MTATKEPCAGDRLCEDLRATVARRVGNLLQHVSVIGRKERIVVEISCRSNYAAQVTLSAIFAGSREGRKRPVHLSIRVAGRVLVVHLPPTPSTTPDARCGSAAPPLFERRHD